MSDGAIVVTGASGFVGGHLCRRLAQRGDDVRALVRARGARSADDSRIRVVGDLAAASEEALVEQFEGARAVVHLAARVHVMREASTAPLEAYRAANVTATARVAKAAALAGVERLVFASSVKVLGDHTDPGRPFRDTDAPQPADAYAQSKYEAEQLLSHFAHQHDLAVAILRPVLVYGPGVGGNFLRLWRAVARGVPLPLAGVDNRRTLLYVGNLVQAILALLDAPAAQRGVWLAGDPEPLSTPELARHISAALGVRARLIPLPSSWFANAARLTGRQAAWTRLAGTLTVDASPLAALVGAPEYSLVQGLAATATWWATPA